MTSLFLRMFVKNHRNTDSPAVRAAIGKMAGITGIVCNFLLFVGKLLAGWSTGAVSVIADATNNLFDASSSLITLLGFRMARRSADREHPYGHARYEYLSGLVISAMILLVGTELIKSSISKILHPVPVHFTTLAFVILLVSIAVKLWLTVFYLSLSKRIRSSTLRATALDSRNDVIATISVLIGAGLSQALDWNIDGWIGLAVAVFIFYSGIRIAKETVSPLLGKQADSALFEEISRAVLSHDKILGIHDLLIHDYGPGQYFASVHAEISAEEDPLLCHDLIDDIETAVLEQLNVHLVIHYDPVLPNDSEWTAMKCCIEEILASIEPALSMHDFRIVKGAKHSKLVFDIAIPYALQDLRSSLKPQIDQALLSQGKHYTTVIRFDWDAGE